MFFLYIIYKIWYTKQLLRFFGKLWRCTQVAEGTALEMQQVGIHSDARVQIPPSPFLIQKRLSQNSNQAQYIIYQQEIVISILCLKLFLQQPLIFIFKHVFSYQKTFLFIILLPVLFLFSSDFFSNIFKMHIKVYINLSSYKNNIHTDIQPQH